MTPAGASDFGPYELIEQIGAGGMGVVYRARDRRLLRDVAIKVLPLGVLSDDTARTRFRREAVALAKLSQPNIATLYDVGEQDGVSYLVMECVAGESLARRLESGPLPIRDVVSLGIDIAAALAEAHEHAIVHRDLKPANVIVTPKGLAKVLDFGLAKWLEPSMASGMSLSLTETQGAVGTLLYMSPEQALGEAVDRRTDIWSLGVLLYESIAGTPPFRGVGTLGILSAITQTEPEPLRWQRPDVPPELERIVSRALSKDAAQRYQSASDIEHDLAALLAELSGTRPADAAHRAPHVPLRWAAVAVAIAVVVSGWWYRQWERRHWAGERAPLEIAKLRSADRPLGAFLLLDRARRYLPSDSQLTAIAKDMTNLVSVVSLPPGAEVEIEDYVMPDGHWYRLGTTPLSRVAIPKGYFRWRLTRPGQSAVVLAPMLSQSMRFALDSIAGAPAGMVYAGGRPWADFIDFIGWVGPYDLPPFYLDRYEVSNDEYQRFIDSGGYERREYWKERFVDGGREIDWAGAMARFRDSTGRAGPSTWKGGHYPDGQGNFPVSGVSWYEAAAYAAYAGKVLPAMAQWFDAAPPYVAAFTVRTSNISHDRMAAVGAFPGVGPFGTYDMAGNVKEWVANPVDGGQRMILGGAWGSETYLYSEVEALSPFDRSPTNGFRCARNIRPIPAAALAPIKPFNRDFSKATPASDEVFRAYQLLYAYDRTPLDARVEGAADASDWRKERVSFNTAYGGRLTAYLFLPKRARPPFQTVVFFPSARVLDLTNSESLGDTSFFDFVVQSGRAVLYPIYQGTYERRAGRGLPGASQAIALTVHRYKDLARSIDYLATRADIDTTRIAYLGVSMGAAEGVIYTTLLQARLRTDVLLDGGFFLDGPRAGSDQADFAPRLKIPVLMVNGRYDYSFSLERAQKPLFRMLGAPTVDKRHVVLDTPHDVRAKHAELVRTVLGWLDKYVGLPHRA